MDVQISCIEGKQCGKPLGKGVAARRTGDGYAAQQWGRAASGDGVAL
jgi:hypothetical protein